MTESCGREGGIGSKAEGAEHEKGSHPPILESTGAFVVAMGMSPGNNVDICQPG